MKNLSLKSYQNRLNFLEKNFVHVAVNFEAKSPTELVPDHLIDLTRSYIVLAYAETEEMVELLSLAHTEYIFDHLQWLKKVFEHGNNLDKSSQKILLEMITPIISSDPKKQKTLSEIISSNKVQKKEIYAKFIDSLIGSAKNIRSSIFANNGLNSKDITKLFDKNGFDTENNFIELRNDLDLLTFKRCRYAHTGKINPDSEIQKNMPTTIAIGYIPRASEEIKKIKQIISHLEKLVERMRALPILHDETA